MECWHCTTSPAVSAPAATERSSERTEWAVAPTNTPMSAAIGRSSIRAGAMAATAAVSEASGRMKGAVSAGAVMGGGAIPLEWGWMYVAFTTPRNGCPEAADTLEVPK